MQRLVWGMRISALVAVLVWAVLVWAETPRTDIWDFVNGMRLGSGVRGSSSTIITGAPGSQNAAVVLPPNSVGGGEVSGMPLSLVFCGEAAENGTIYLSPHAGINMVAFNNGADASLGSTVCDALDGATEATQDIVLFPQSAFKIMGMYCYETGAEALGSAETMTFTFRADAANTVPAITCTVSEAQTSCRSLTGTTTNVAANAAVAMQLVMASNNTAQEALCVVSVMLQ